MLLLGSANVAAAVQNAVAVQTAIAVAKKARASNLRILISGARGFIGKPLVERLQKAGHQIVPLVRIQESGSVFWDPEKGLLNRADFEDFDAVIHLSGENIAGRWGTAKKRKIQYSRTVSTFLLAHVLAQLYRPPKVFISPSAVGYYGDCGDQALVEESPPGGNFLAKVCSEWERAAGAIAARGSRVVHPRFGMVLGPHGGALQKMLLPYKLGLGGCLGSGQQWVSWVALEDALRALELFLEDENLEGSFNVVSPQPVRQIEFARCLASHLHRPALFHQPAWLLHLLFGQMADEVLLASAKVVPAKLNKAHFTFKFHTLDSALLFALK